MCHFLSIRTRRNVSESEMCSIRYALRAYPLTQFFIYIILEKKISFFCKFSKHIITSRETLLCLYCWPKNAQKRYTQKRFFFPLPSSFMRKMFLLCTILKGLVLPFNFFSSSLRFKGIEYGFKSYGKTIETIFLNEGKRSGSAHNHHQRQEEANLLKMNHNNLTREKY